jgi:hypothetical protein
MPPVLYKPEIFDKHKIYASAYQPGDTFWGIGIECEAYIETANQQKVATKRFLTDQRSERYSVPYYKTYKDGIYNDAVKGLVDMSGVATIPYLLNAHSLTRVDISGEHTTAFVKAPATDHYNTVPNSRCKGSIMSQLAEQNSYFKLKDELQAADFILDGDSIEIATRDFYKTTVEECIIEFRNRRAEFVDNLNTAWIAADLPSSYLPLTWMHTNHPFAIYHSNPKNIGIFNNGTYHFNFTIPTRLSTIRPLKPVDAHVFIKKHRAAARIIQWLEPFLIVNYGTPDPLAKSSIMGHRFSAASQRAAVSRYIGIGSYDTHKMIQGKLNTIPRADARVAAEDGWMTAYQSQCAYKPLDEVGTDINFHKHYTHGLELRFFDYFSENRLEPLLGTLVQALDHAQIIPVTVAPDSALWNTIVEEAMLRGRGAQIYSWMAQGLSSALNLEIRPGPMRRVWHDIQRQLEKRWLGVGECSKVMIGRRRYLWEHITRSLKDTTVAAPIGTTGAQNISPKPTEPVAIIAPRVNPMHLNQRQPLLPTIPEVDLPSMKKGICGGGGCTIQ